jgi:hypothetical protein
VKKIPLWVVVFVFLFIIAVIGGGHHENAPAAPPHQESKEETAYEQCLIEHIGAELSIGRYKYAVFAQYFNKKCEAEMNGYLLYDDGCMKDVASCRAYTALAPLMVLPKVPGLHMAMFKAPGQDKAFSPCMAAKDEHSCELHSYLAPEQISQDVQEQ